MKAVRVHQFGGPEVLTYEDAPEPELAPGDVLVRMQVIGVNYSDTHYRRGSYSTSVPLIPGHEGGGSVLELGEGVTGFNPGDNVVFSGQHRRGTYKEIMSVPAQDLVKVPGDIGVKLATAVLNQGRTAHYLVQDVHPLKAGERVLIHAAAGGVGSNLVQMAKQAGAYVYATVSSIQKADFATELGADEVILYTDVDFEDEIKARTSGAGVDVVFDALGGEYLLKSMRCLAPRGHVVTYGQTAGHPPPLDWPQRGLGSLYLSYHTGADYTHADGEAVARAEDLFRWMREGSLKVHVHAELPLSQASEAHRAIESRETIGKLLLIP